MAGAASHWPLIVSRTMLLVSLATLVALVWDKVTLPALGTDTLIYHLTIPAQWLHAGLWAQGDLPFHDQAAEHSPMLMQTLSYLLMRLSGDDSLCFVLGPLMMAAMLWVFHSSARLLGAPRPVALAMTAVAATFKPFLDSVQTVNNDMLLALGAGVMLHGLVLGRRRPRTGLIWGACGIAIMLLAKTVAAIYAGVGILVLTPLAVRCCRRTDAARGPRALWLVVLAAGIVAAGSAFFIRNWVCYGNPLYPASVHVGGWTVFGGLYDTSAMVTHGWSPSAIYGMIVASDAIFAPSLPEGILMAGSLAGAAVLAIVSPRGRRFASATVAFPLLAGAAFFLLVPFWQQHRLLFPVYLAMLLAGARVGGVLCRANRRVAVPVVVLVLAALVAVRLARLEVLLETWFIVALGAAAALSLLHWPAGSVKYIARPAVIVAVVLAAATSYWWHGDLAAERQKQRGQLYAKYYGPLGEAWATLDDLGRRQSQSFTVAYTGTPLTFPLFGPRLENRVVYVPLSPDDRPQAIDIRADDVRAGQSINRMLAEARRKRVDEAYWLDGLRRSGVQWLLVDDDPSVGGAKQELGIIAAHPTEFSPAYSGGGVRLFHVNARPPGK